MNVRLLKIEERLKALEALESRYQHLADKYVKAIEKIGDLEQKILEHANAPHGRQRTQSHR